LVFGVLFGPSNLVSLVTADGDDIDPRKSIEQGVNMSLSHAAQASNADVEASGRHVEMKLCS
jgi:hypothetical protein